MVTLKLSAVLVAICFLLGCLRTAKSRPQKAQTILRNHVHSEQSLSATRVARESGMESASFVIGGTDADPNEYPFAAMILYGGEFICGGILHNALTVITAKHCVQDAAAEYIIVRLGEHKLRMDSETEQNIDVSEIKLHPDPNIDLALIILKKPPQFNNAVSIVAENFRKVNGSLVQEVPRVGHPVTVVGWGWINQEGQSADTLQKLTLPLASHASCEAEGLIMAPHDLCAGLSAGEYVNACHGDSGGALLVRETAGGPWKLLGIVQGGHDGCPRDERYAVFTSIVPVRQWILENQVACFPGSASVETPLGLKEMSKLQVGDLVLTIQPNGRTDYSPVISFIHREPTVWAHFYKLSTTESGNITLSSKHLIFKASETSGKFRAATAVFASNMQVGDKVFVPTNSGLKAVRVTSVSDSIDAGIYAPLTSSGNIIVDHVVASCYASFQHHEIAHLAFAPFRWFSVIKAWWESTYNEQQQYCEVDQCTPLSSNVGIHWYPRVLMSVFSSFY